MKIALLLLSVCLVVLPLVSWGQQETITTGSLDRELALDLLRRLEQKHKEVKSVYGEFEQIKVSRIFLEEIKAQGKFYYQKPGKFRCDYLPPDESVNLILDNVAWFYVPEIKQVEKYYFKEETSKLQRLNRMLLGFGVKLQDILEVYQVEPVAHTPGRSLAIKFTPKDPEEEFNFLSITIWFDLRKLLPEKLLIKEPGNEETTITIKKIRLNEDLKEDLFMPIFPKDVEIIEQM